MKINSLCLSDPSPTYAYASAGRPLPSQAKLRPDKEGVAYFIVFFNKKAPPCGVQFAGGRGWGGSIMEGFYFFPQKILKSRPTPHQLPKIVELVWV